MNAQFDNEDEILRLVRKEGLIKPSGDFTSRVMQGIYEGRVPATYSPLLSRKTWILLSAGFLSVIIICWFILGGESSESLFSMEGILNRAGKYFSKVDLSINFNANALLIVTLAMLSMGLLLSIDLYFSNNRRSNTV